jgi:outer membrane protein TolC
MALALAGCAAGPDYQRPATPEPAQFTRQPPAATASSAHGAAQQWSNDPISPAWWQMFGSPALDARVQRALERNPDLQAATAALLQAQENVAAQRAAFLPTAQLGYTPSRQREVWAPSRPPCNRARRCTRCTPRN